MRKLKKFKRFSQGGLGSSEGEGDPFAKKTEFAPGQGERNLEGIKDFFMGRRSRGEASAPIEERDTSRKTPEPVKAEPEKAEPAKAGTERVQKPAVTTTDTTPKDRGETDFNYEPQRPYNQALEDAKEQGRRARDAFKPAKPAADKPINISTGASGFKFPKEKTSEPSSKPSYVGAGDSDDSVETKNKNEVERLKRVGSGAVEQTMMGPVETIALGASKLPSMARAGFGAARKAYDEFTTPSVGKGTGKFPEAKPEIQVSNKPAVERVKDAKIEGPPKPPRQETSADKMGVRETSAMEKTRKANEEGPPDVGARARRVAEDTAKADKQAETTMAAAGRRAQQTRADEKQAADAMAAASKRAKENRAAEKQAADSMASAGARAKETRASEKQASDAMAAANKRTKEARAQNRIKDIKEEHRKPGFMQEYIAGRAQNRNRIKDLPNDGLAARYENKKGGKIPAFKKGGSVSSASSRADGCATKGKTRGRMM